jgi:hypothetical protein
VKTGRAVGYHCNQWMTAVISEKCLTKSGLLTLGGTKRPKLDLAGL